MKLPVVVFCDGVLVGEYSFADFKLESLTWDKHLYNNAWIYYRLRDDHPYFGPGRGWFRGDMTPYPENQVPKNLRATLLLLS